MRQVEAAGPSKAASFKERMQRRQVEEQRKKEKGQAGDAARTYIPLEIQYKEALHLSHDHLNERSQSFIAGAEDLLQACSDDILFTLRVPALPAMEEEEEEVDQLPDADDTLDDDAGKISRSDEKGDEDDNEIEEEEEDNEDEEEEEEEEDEVEVGGEESSIRRVAAEGDED